MNAISGPVCGRGKPSGPISHIRPQRMVGRALLACCLVIAGCQGMSGTLNPEDEEIPAPTIVGSIASADPDDAPDPEPAGERDAVDTYIPPEPGTILTWRNNWKSLPPKISYRVEKPVSIGGKLHVKLASVAGLEQTTYAYYDAENFNLKGYRDAGDRALVTYKPVEQRYRFPLKPGEQWVTSWKSKDHRKGDVQSGGGIVHVIGFEELKLPAGQFRTVKVRMPLPPEMRRMRHYIWFAPELGVTVKEQISDGRLNWTQVLEEVKLPG